MRGKGTKTILRLAEKLERSQQENIKLEKQNKRYRELIQEMGQEIEILTDVMSSAGNADELNEEVIRLKGALESESN